MIDYEEHNTEVCEKYQRYVVEVCCQQEEYYTICGADKTDFNEMDKLLVDDDQHFLLFRDVESAIDYAKQWQNAFDKKGFEGWLAEIKMPVESYVAIDVDLLNVDSIDVNNVPLFDYTLSARNFVSDYCYQIKEEQWCDAFSSYPLINFFDAFIDRHFWSGVEKPEPVTEQLLTDVIQKHKDLYTFLMSKVKVWDKAHYSF